MFIRCILLAIVMLLWGIPVRLANTGGMRTHR